MRRKSLCILFSFFILVFASCTKQATSLLDAPDCMYSDGEFMFVKWAGYRWAVIPQYELSKPFRFELLLMDGHESYFAKIRQTIIDEFGEPYMTDRTMPRDTVPDLIISEVFLLANGRYPDEKESLTFWKTETPNLTIRLYTAQGDSGVDLPSFAVITIFDMDELMKTQMNIRQTSLPQL